MIWGRIVWNFFCLLTDNSSYICVLVHVGKIIILLLHHISINAELTSTSSTIIGNFKFLKVFTKVSFFWDQTQDMISSGFLPSKQTSELVYLIRGLFFSRGTTWTHILTWISGKTDFTSGRGFCIVSR